MFLSKLSNCDPTERMTEWRRSGGALLNNTNIGCGINSLTFLGVFSREQGEDLVRIINPRGTTFLEMMNYVARYRNGDIQREVIFPIGNVNEVQDFINIIKTNLGQNSCTVAKMMRYPDNSNTPVRCNNVNVTSGHSIIFGTENVSGVNTLHAIDPQQNTHRRSEDARRAFRAWQSNCYTHIHVMYSGGVLQNSNQVHVPMEIVVNEINFPNHNHAPMETNHVPMDVEGGKKYRTKKYRTKKYRTKKYRTKKIYYTDKNSTK